MNLRWIAACAVVWMMGCGGASGVEPEATATSTETSGDERGEPNDGAQITGLMGTIRPAEVQGALNGRMSSFMRCFEARMGDVEFLAGDIRLAFRIDVEGNVLWVYPAESSLGDRQAEQCVLDVARGTRFPRPHGGEAEFAWGFGFDAPEDVRPPLNWAPEALGEQLEEAGEVADACDAAGEITAYIRPGGTVLSAGGSVSSADAEAGLDCILEQVRAWEMPDPGSYAAKVTFAVQ